VLDMRCPLVWALGGLLQEKIADEHGTTLAAACEVPRVIRFECFWVPLTRGHVLSGGQGALLGRL
jgi:hypothetical protein